MMRQALLAAAMVLALQPGATANAARVGETTELPPASETAPPSPVPVELNSDYRITGSKSLRPVRISDDGVHTYIEWSEDQALPAVFAVSALGGEEIVEGYMRAGIFTIDRVNRELVFRIDRQWAKAKRGGGK